MYIPRVSELFLGYRIFKVEAEDIKRAANLLLRIGVSVRFSREGAFAVKLIDLKRVRAALADNVSFQEGEPLGLPGFFYRHRRCYGAAAAFFLIVLCMVFSTRLVWDVRIECDEAIDKAAVSRELFELGLYPGAFWSRVDKSALENKLLSLSEEVGWANVNQRGTVAYVRVMNRDIGVEPTDPVGYANIVASEDAIVEQLIVKRGYEAVKVGETVRRGQVLVSGIYPAEAGGGICYAEAEILGRVTGQVVTTVARDYELYEYRDERLLEMRLNFFGFSVNIFKNYGNLDNTCDIINDTTVITLFGKCSLPISTLRVIAIPKTVRTLSYTDGELVEKARREHENAIREYLSHGDLVRIRTVGEFTDSGYTYTSYVVAILPIGKSVPIETE